MSKKELTSNVKANQVIEEAIQNTIYRKKIVLSDILRVLNRICEEHDLQYFAIGKLLSFSLSEDESFLSGNTFNIGMLRKDYEEFFRGYSSSVETNNVKLIDCYNKYGVLQSVRTYLEKREIFQEEDDINDITMKVVIHPLDTLPQDEGERTEFLKQAEERNQYYRSLSRSYRNLRKDAGKLRGPFMKGLFLLEKAWKRTSFTFEKKKLKDFYKSYEDQQSDYVGRVEIYVHPAWNLTSIFPCEKREFLGTTLYLPVDTDFFKAYHPEEEKKRALNSRLHTLKKFHELCEKYDVTYFAIQNLAMIASHESGFVPDEETASWSLGLPRKHYTRALQLLKSEEGKSLRIKDSVSEHPFICNNKIGILLEGYEKKAPDQMEYPIYLIPFDDLPDEYDVQLTYLRDVREKAVTMKELIEYEKGKKYLKPDTRLNSWGYFKRLQRDCSWYSDKDAKSALLYMIGSKKIEIYAANEIFPVSEIPFYDIRINVARNPYLWYRKVDQKRNEYISEERTKILKEVHKLAKENGISYFAIADLLKGAVIYHDSIPDSQVRNWDLGMLRDDYEHFCRIARNLPIKSGLAFYESLDGMGKYPHRTKFITYAGYKYSHIKIRILPFDKVSDDLYLYNGFLDEIKEKNYIYKKILEQYDINALTLKRSSINNNQMEELLSETTPAKVAWEIDQLAQFYNDDNRVKQYMRISLEQSKPIEHDQLFPIKEVEFRDTVVCCPHNTSVWQPVLDAELDRQVKCIQRADLLLLEEFDRVCRKMGLGYFVCGGTMLGYMRHGGFIPWDDDVDVAMLREDYEAFIHGAGIYLKDRFFLQTRETDPNIPYLFSKIRLDDTEYITSYNDERDFHKGICLDIFPFDFLPDNPKERNSFVNEVKKCAKEHHLIARRQYPFPETEAEPRNEKERQYIEEQKKLLEEYWEQDLSESQAEYLSIATRYNDKAEELKLHTVGSFVPSYTWIDLADLLPYQRGKFEGLDVSVPKRPDVFLKMQYGNYMELPPKHMQIAHPLLRWSTWEDSSDRKDES